MRNATLKLFLAGDVMTGRGIDQILPHPSEPQLFEPWVQSAQEYVALAERRHGPIVRPVDVAYVWGAALAELHRAQPAVRIVNLETAVTSSDDAWPDKGIHYRMNPARAAAWCGTARRSRRRSARRMRRRSRLRDRSRPPARTT